MPLVKRSVSPASLCRNKIPAGIKNELECVTNKTLSGVISQLASLSQHAEDVFGELFVEANTFYGRANNLQDRIDKLSLKVTQLDSNVEEVSLHDINLRKAFKSSVVTDQQVVSRESMPQSLKGTYRTADAPPPLQDLNVFRDDGRDGLKIYTDPDYFFDLWREAIQRETREAKERRREQRKKVRRQNPTHRAQQTVKQVHNSRLEMAKRRKDGAEFVTDNITAQQREKSPNNTSSVNNTPNQRSSSSKQRQSRDYHDQHEQLHNKYIENDINSMPPPPPAEMPHSYEIVPPPPMDSSLPPPINDVPPPPMPDVPPPPAPMSNSIHAPPPPPPPVPLGAPPGPPPPPGLPDTSLSEPSEMSKMLLGVQLKKAGPAAPPPTDARSGLLSAIRDGINLKKVEETERNTQSGGNANDVASILARRIAVEYSDSDESSNWSEDEDNWD